LLFLRILPAGGQVEQVGPGQPLQVLVGGAAAVGSRLLPGHDGGLLDRARPGDGGQAQARPPAGSALSAGQFRGVGAAAGEHLVTLGGGEQPLGLGRHPAAIELQLDLAQVVGHVQDRHALADPTV
jgi:hypothetical protein